MKKIKKAYRDWHDYDNHHVFHWLIFFFVAITCATLVWGQIKNWVYTELDQPIVDLYAASAVLSLEPQVKEIKVGDKFNAAIILDTKEAPIDAVDIYALHYDPTILRVIDGSSTQEGIQLIPGAIMDATAVNIVDEKTGSIKFGGLSTGGTIFNGKGVLATIQFEAIAPGTTFLKFDFEKGNTVDTNAAHRGKDQLARAVDAIYSVSPK